MDSFNFHLLDQNALEQTLAFFQAYPEPPLDITAEFDGFSAMLDDAVAEHDWMADIESQNAGQTGPTFGLSVSEGEKQPAHTYRQTTQGGEGFARDLPPMLALVGRTVSCSWADCPYSTRNQNELTDHLEDHLKRTPQPIYPSRCLWKGCKSKVVFKSQSVYKKHLQNIHTHPLTCNTPGCSVRKSFRDQTNLKRHKTTAHSEERDYEYPYNACEAETKTFARKDKWAKHIRDTQHENDAFCPFGHCRRAKSSPFDNRKNIVHHFKNSHPALKAHERIECRLVSCEQNMHSSHFTRGGIDEHLLEHHKIKRLWLNTQALKREANNMYWIFTVDDMRGKKWHDCSLCSGQDDHL